MFPQLVQHNDDYKGLTKNKTINSARQVREKLAMRISDKSLILRSFYPNVVYNLHFALVCDSNYEIVESFRKFLTIKTLDGNKLQVAEFTNKILQVFEGLNAPHFLMRVRIFNMTSIYSWKNGGFVKRVIKEMYERLIKDVYFDDFSITTLNIEGETYLTFSFLPSHLQHM